MTDPAQLDLPTTGPSGAAQVIDPARRALVLGAYQEALGRLQAAGICLLDLRAELSSIFPGRLASLDHAADLAEHASGWYERTGLDEALVTDALAQWERAIREADELLSSIRARREVANG